jgi:hypothetical protein
MPEAVIKTSGTSQYRGTATLDTGEREASTVKFDGIKIWAAIANTTTASEAISNVRGAIITASTFGEIIVQSSSIKAIRITLRIGIGKSGYQCAGINRHEGVSSESWCIQ